MLGDEGNVVVYTGFRKVLIAPQVDIWGSDLVQTMHSETSDISHIQDFQPSSNSSICRVTTFDIWEIPPKFSTSYSFQFQDIPRTLILAKVVFYHAPQWKIVFSYGCLGPWLHSLI